MSLTCEIEIKKYCQHTALIVVVKVLEDFQEVVKEKLEHFFGFLCPEVLKEECLTCKEEMWTNKVN